MKPSTSRRRAFTMTLVLIVMTVVVGALVVLSYFSAAYYRTHQADRVRLTTRAVTDSVAAYARAQAPHWRDHRPTSPVSVDITSLLPANTEGSAVISFPADNNPSLCHVTVQVIRGRYQAGDEFDLNLALAPATRSTTATAPE